MIIRVTTKSDMSNIEEVMAETAREILIKTGNTMHYSVSREGDVTTINLPQTTFAAKKGRFNGWKFELKKRMLKTAIQAACLKYGHSAEVDIE